MIKKDERGFTLVELTVSMLLFVILVAAAMGFLRNTSVNLNRQNTAVEGQQNLRDAINKISTYVLPATFVAVENNNTAFKIDGVYRIYWDNDKTIKIAEYNKYNYVISNLPISEPVGDFKVYSIVYEKTVRVVIYDINKKYFLETFLTPRND